jgi:hypothetical protein
LTGCWSIGAVHAEGQSSSSHNTGGSVGDWAAERRTDTDNIKKISSDCLRVFRLSRLPPPPLLFALFVPYDTERRILVPPSPGHRRHFVARPPQHAAPLIKKAISDAVDRAAIFISWVAAARSAWNIHRWRGRGTKRKNEARKRDTCLFVPSIPSDYTSNRCSIDPRVS